LTLIKRAVVLLFFLLPAYTAKAQQDPVYTQYMNNLLSVNPAYSAVRGYPSLTSIFRKQWLGFEGAPTTTSLTYSWPFDSLHVSGGIDFIYDYTVPTATLGLFFNYGYKFRITEKLEASLGLKAGFNYLQGKLTDLDRYHIDDSYILTYGDFRRLMPNFGVGGFLFADNYYFGFSIPRLLQNPYNKEDNVFTTKSREERHYFLHGSYSQPINQSIVFQPALTTIMVAGAPITADFDFAFHFDNKFTFGAMYRLSDSFGAYAQFQFSDMKIGLSYDLNHTRLRQHHSGTFEVLLRWDLRYKNPKTEEMLEELGVPPIIIEESP